MKLRFHRYTLSPISTLNSRTTTDQRAGALLQLRFPEFSESGFADLHPWPEFGHLPLDQQLEQLRRGVLTPLTHRSIEFARQDAQARTENRSLFQKLPLPPCHFLVTSLENFDSVAAAQVLAQGFQHLKIKMGRNPARETRKLVELLPEFAGKAKLRLDFNGSLSGESLREFARLSEPLWSAIDFIEDPIAFESPEWSCLPELFACPIALDHRSEEADKLPWLPHVLVLKPAWQDPAPLVALARRERRRLVVTSSMDHVLGQLEAAWCAATVSSETAGLLSHTAYAPTDFSRKLRVEGPNLLAPDGTGFGFDEELHALAWEEL